MSPKSTNGVFKYINPASYQTSTATGQRPWNKVDGPGVSYTYLDIPRPVTSLRTVPSSEFTTQTAGFSLINSPTALQPSDFNTDARIRGPYYEEVISLLEKHEAAAAGAQIKKVVIFDHTIRRRTKDSPRQPVQQVHVDQTTGAAAARVRRHLPAEEVEELLRGRYSIINVWRPIGVPASDFPLAVIDWRSTKREDFVAVDLMYPVREQRDGPDGPNGHTNGNGNGTGNGGANGNHDDDDRGKEKLPSDTSHFSLEGYEARGETFAVAPNEGHRFYYVPDMMPDEVMFLKCFDSYGEGEAGPGGKGGREGLAVRTPHTAFVDPATPVDAPPRQSIEVRCLVFYDE